MVDQCGLFGIRQLPLTYSANSSICISNSSSKADEFQFAIHGIDHAIDLLTLEDSDTIANRCLNADLVAYGAGFRNHECSCD